MYDPNELDAKIARSHINAEKVEQEAKALESKLLENYEFDKKYLPQRTWGQPFDPSKLSMTAKFLIEKHQPHVANARKVREWRSANNLNVGTGNPVF